MQSLVIKQKEHGETEIKNQRRITMDKVEITKEQFVAEAAKFVGDLRDSVIKVVPTYHARVWLMAQITGMTEDIKHRLFDD